LTDISDDDLHHDQSRARDPSVTVLGLPGAIVQREPGGLVLCLADEVDGAVVDAFARGAGRARIPTTAIDDGAVTFIGSVAPPTFIRAGTGCDCPPSAPSARLLTRDAVH
jgi:hypothetical protein